VAPTKSKQPFEELYTQLEAKVSLLEQGGLSLDDSLSAYEAAVELARRCQTLLDEAELRITKLKQTVVASDAYATEAPLDEADEEEV
jgi:exodeoxyribonuclease VII small subunit